MKILSAVLLFVSSSALAANGKFVIGMSQCNLGEPWRVHMTA
jgi:hypothetical protein